MLLLNQQINAMRGRLRKWLVSLDLASAGMTNWGFTCSQLLSEKLRDYKIYIVLNIIKLKPHIIIIFI